MNTHPQCRLWINDIPIIPTPDWWDSLDDKDKIYTLSKACFQVRDFPAIITPEIEYKGCHPLRVLFAQLPTNLQHHIMEFHRGDFS